MLYEAVFANKLHKPIAVLLVPVMLLFNAFNPTAVFLAPVVLANKALYPKATFLYPVVLYYNVS